MFTRINSNTIFSLGAASAVGLALCLVGTSQGAVVFSDGFGDGDRDNDGSNDSGGIVDDAGDVGVAFYRARGTSVTGASLVTDNGVGGIGSGLALKFEPGSTAGRVLSAGFADTTLANVGESITLSFDIRMDPSITANAGLRFGLYSDGGTAIAADFDGNTTLNALGDDGGFFAQVDTGVINGNSADLRYEPVNDLPLGGTGNVFLGASTEEAAGLTLTTAKSVALSITLVDSGVVELAYSVDGINYITSRTDEASSAITPQLTYNEFLLGNAGADIDFLIDNVQVEFTVPEPGSITLIGLGALAVLRRRH